MSITYRIALEIPGEPREAPADLHRLRPGRRGLRRLRPASGRRGPDVRAGQQTKLFDHHYGVFEVKIPELAPFMRAGIRRQYGEEPPV